MKNPKLVGSDGHCFRCGGNGFQDKACPSCGMEPRNKSMNYQFKKDTQQFIEKVDVFGVPDSYRGIVWDSEVLRHDKPELENDYSFQHFVEQLDKINGVFTKGLLSPKSAIIIAPAGFSKMVFAYSCMQRALDSGFSVAPFLDTVELKRMLFLAAEIPLRKLYGKISFDEYVMSDVCFVTVTKLPQREWAYETIQEIMDLRSRKGLSTIILSRFCLSEICKRDASNSFEALSAVDVEDTYKYPVVIKYF